MPLWCDDGEVAVIPPWTPLPEVKRGEPPRMPDPERNRCQRAGCRKVEWQHWTTPPETPDMKRYTVRRDRNEPEVIAALLAVGAAVQQLDGDGIPDLLVGFRGRLTLLEVKCLAHERPSVHRGKGNTLEGELASLTPAQVQWWANWKGPAPVIVRSPEEALAAIGADVSEARGA